MNHVHVQRAVMEHIQGAPVICMYSVHVLLSSTGTQKIFSMLTKNVLNICTGGVIRVF